MREHKLWLALLALCVLTGAAQAQAPAGSTGLCKDGSYWSSPTKRGACHGHQGVKEWYGAADSAPAPAPAPAAPASVPAPNNATAPIPAGGSTAHANVPAKTQAAGAAPGLVWVNSASRVYHCPADRWYGRTKQGEYMSESEATAKGYRPDHGKSCK